MSRLTSRQPRQLLISLLKHQALRTSFFFRKNIRKKPLLVLGAVLGLIVVVLLLTVMKALVFIVLLVVLGSVSMIYNRFVKLSLGVEFVMLATVLSAITYGPVVGMLVGALTLFLAEFVAWDINYHIFVSIIGIVIVGLVAYFLRGLPLVVLGLGMVVLYNAIIMPLYLMMGSSPVKCAIFTVTHFLWNAWVFSAVAPFIHRFMV